MNFTNIPLFDVMKQKMQYHSSRQAVLAQNVANVDTPNYLAKDIKSPDFSAMAKSSFGAHLRMAETNRNHMQPGMGKGGMSSVMQREDTYELNPIGNNVVVEEEVMRVAENQSEYQKVLGIYRKSLEMFRIALGRSGGGA